MKKVLLFSLILLVLLLSVSANAQESVKGKKYGLGWQSTFPVIGLSGKYVVNEKVSGQLILGFFGDLSTYGAKVNYKFNEKENYSLYGFGLLGLFAYSSPVLQDDWTFKDETETAIGFGAGAGLEYFFPEFLPEVGWNLEIGFGSIQFDEVDYDFTSIMIGAGAHYYF